MLKAEGPASRLEPFSPCRVHGRLEAAQRPPAQRAAHLEAAHQPSAVRGDQRQQLAPAAHAPAHTASAALAGAGAGALLTAAGALTGAGGAAAGVRVAGTGSRGGGGGRSGRARGAPPQEGGSLGRAGPLVQVGGVPIHAQRRHLAAATRKAFRALYDKARQDREQASEGSSDPAPRTVPSCSGLLSPRPPRKWPAPRRWTFPAAQATHNGLYGLYGLYDNTRSLPAPASYVEPRQVAHGVRAVRQHSRARLRGTAGEDSPRGTGAAATPRVRTYVLWVSSLALVSLSTGRPSCQAAHPELRCAPE